MPQPVLEWRDREYFNSCIEDQQSLMVPVIIRRCVAIVRNSEYPDDPPTRTFEDISVRADLREVALQEIAHSGGLLITGDNIIWTQEPLRGPNTNTTDAFDPASVADTIIVHNQEFSIVGSPLVGRMADPIIVGYQAYIRRRQGGYLAAEDTQNDSNK